MTKDVSKKNAWEIGNHQICKGIFKDIPKKYVEWIINYKIAWFSLKIAKNSCQQKLSKELPNELKRKY